MATFKGGQNLNFAIPSAYVSALACGTKAAVPLPKPTERAKEPKAKSILEDLGGRSTEGVSVAQFTWDSISGDGEFSLSLRNNLRDPVRGVSCLLTFCGNDEKPIDIAIVELEDVIPAGMAKRVKGQVAESVEKLNTPTDQLPPRTNLHSIEFRVLYFDLVPDGQSRDDGPSGARRGKSHEAE